jgi:hypothetical protein
MKKIINKIIQIIKENLLRTIISSIMIHLVCFIGTPTKPSLLESLEVFITFLIINLIANIVSDYFKLLRNLKKNVKLKGENK